jgi:hypothetical protein
MDGEGSEATYAAGFFPIGIGDLVSGSAMQRAGVPLAVHDLVWFPAPWE